MTDSFGAAFGRLIKRKRAESRMTQAQLACALYPNLDPAEAEKRKGDISKLENGKVPNPTIQTIKRLSDALGITDDDLDALQRRAQMSTREQLDNLSVLDRDQLELLAGRFEIERAFAKSDEELVSILNDKAQDYRAIKLQIATLPDHVPEVMKIKAEAEKAAEALDFAKVEDLLTAADILDTAAAAQTKLTRASNALLRGRTGQAFDILTSVADSFRSTSPVAPIKLRAQLFTMLRDHGLRYGGDGLNLAERMLEHAAAAMPDKPPDILLLPVFGNLAMVRINIAPRLVGPDSVLKFNAAIKAYKKLLIGLPRDVPDWALSQNNLGAALQELGVRTGGADGTRLLKEAVSAYRAALEGHTREAMPVQWAMTQNNLGNALANQGTRTGGEDGTSLLAEAVTAYRAAQEVRTREAMPEEWARTQNNLGNVLANQGTRTGGEDGTSLLAEAVAAYRAALEVHTRETMPVDWAMTQNNLGNTLANQGTRTGGEDGTSLLAEAVTACRAALEVRTREAMPVHWAMTQNNLGNALLNQGTRTGGEDGTSLLAEAVTAYRAALEVQTREEMPVQWAMTQNNLGGALQYQGTRTGGEDGTRLLAEAVAAYRAALEVRTREAMPVQWAMTQNNLGAALADQGTRTGGEDGTRLLAEAVAACRAALEVRTREAMPVDWAMTQKNMGLTLEDLADIDPDNADTHLSNALEALDNALRVYDPDHMSYDHGTATTARTRIAAKLAAL